MNTITNIEKPRHLINLINSAIIVTMEITVWNTTITNKTEGEEVTRRNKAKSSKAVRVMENLFPDVASYDAVIKYRAGMYNWIKTLTHNWAGSSRLLPVSEMPTFMSQYNQRYAEFFALVDKFVAEYPALVSNMAFDRGDLLKREQYPSPQQVRDAFTVNLYRAEVPSGDFHVKLADDLATDLHEHYSRETQRLIDKLVQEQVDNFTDPLIRLAKSCAVEVGDDGKVVRGRVYESTVDKVLELIDKIAGFNPTESVALESARIELDQAMRGVTVDTLRNSDTLRERVQTDITSILDKFKSFAI